MSIFLSVFLLKQKTKNIFTLCLCLYFWNRKPLSLSTCVFEQCRILTKTRYPDTMFLWWLQCEWLIVSIWNKCPRQRCFSTDGINTAKLDRRCERDYSSAYLHSSWYSLLIALVQCYFVIVFVVYSLLLFNAILLLYL